MAESAAYEVVETIYKPDKQTKIVFTGTLDEAKARAMEEARKNIGVRYTVFRHGSSVGEFQAFYRTTVKCPQCGTVIPIE